MPCLVVVLYAMDLFSPLTEGSSLTNSSTCVEERLALMFSLTFVFSIQALSACLRHNFVDEALFGAAGRHMAVLLRRCHAADQQSESR